MTLPQEVPTEWSRISGNILAIQDAHWILKAVGAGRGADSAHNPDTFDYVIVGGGIADLRTGSPD